MYLYYKNKLRLYNPIQDLSETLLQYWNTFVSLRYVLSVCPLLHHRHFYQDAVNTYSSSIIRPNDIFSIMSEL